MTADSGLPSPLSPASHQVTPAVPQCSLPVMKEVVEAAINADLYFARLYKIKPISPTPSHTHFGINNRGIVFAVQKEEGSAITVAEKHKWVPWHT